MHFLSTILLNIYQFIGMDNSEILKQIQSIQKEGFCDKQSRFLKSWRKWIVLTNNLLLTYKERRVYQSPTEVILLKDIVSIKTCEEETQMKNAFKVETNETVFFFCCENSLEKEQWIGGIGIQYARQVKLWSKEIIAIWMIDLNLCILHHIIRRDQLPLLITIKHPQMPKAKGCEYETNRTNQQSDTNHQPIRNRMRKIKITIPTVKYKGYCWNN